MYLRCYLLPALAVATALSFSPALAGPRIVNGVDTQNRPTTGALLFAGGATGFQQICTGTLIGCETFLTAAHCVCNSGDTFADCNPSEPEALAIYTQNGGIMAVTAVAVAPNYEFGVAGDIAVLTVMPPPVGTGTPPTPINAAMDPPFGTEADIAGYGIISGSGGQSGVLREGSVVTSSCSGSVPEPDHVCWSFESPVGAVGEDSNTCNGDSGGPLFADLGGGEVVIGVTSGGDAFDCLPTDLSFDANVFQNAAFIQAVGGVDLANTSCGAISQVGDVGTQIITLAPDNFSSGARKCRKAIGKTVVKYVKTVLSSRRRCIDGVYDGSVSGPCPDASTADRIALAALRVDATKLGKKCSAGTLTAAGLGGSCAGAVDADDLAVCILTDGDAAADAALEAVFTNPAAVSNPAPGFEDCQIDAARAAMKYNGAVHKTLDKCQRSFDSGKVTSCPDAKSAAKLAKAVTKLSSALADACSDDDVANLNGGGGEFFGGSCSGAADAVSLVVCQPGEQDAAVMQALGVMSDPSPNLTTSFTVDPGTVTLRATLNGDEDGGNDLDIFLRKDTPPTTEDFDARGFNVGMFEHVEFGSPGAGTWHVLVDEFSGTNVNFQLTITLFK